MKSCDQCEKKLTCCRCGKLLCRPVEQQSMAGGKNASPASCRKLGYYKIIDEKVCADCYK